jgi:transposase
MANYKPDYSHQNQFIAVDFSAQIVPGTFEYALSHIVDNHLDLSTFDARYENDKGGAPAYSPAIMLKVILFAYSRGYISSRRIAQACQTNITFMALSGDAQPHFTSIANFVAKMSDNIEPLFTQVLMICEQENLIGHNMFAIDGCKLPSNASKEWSGTHQELKQKTERLKQASKRIIAAHKAQDELPDTEITQDLKQKEKLDNTAKKIESFLAKEKERMGNRNTPVKSNITDNDSAKMTTSKGTIQGYNGIAISDDKHQIILQAQAWGSVAEQQTLQPAIKQLQNTLSKIQHADSLQTAKFSADSGFNSHDNIQFLANEKIDAYIADTSFRSRNPLFQSSQTYQKNQAKKRKTRTDKSHKLFTHQDFTFNKATLTCTCPAGNSMWLTAKPKENATHTRFQAYLKDCRDCPMRELCMQKEPNKHGRQVSIPIEKQRTKAQILSDKMKAKIDSPQGRREYSKRLGCIEPVFANITKNKGMDYFTLRGKTKVNAQWQMYCLVHNIEKLRNSLQ